MVQCLMPSGEQALLARKVVIEVDNSPQCFTGYSWIVQLFCNLKIHLGLYENSNLMVDHIFPFCFPSIMAMN